MDFKKWFELEEVSTSTGDIAGYSPRWSPGGDGAVVRSRLWPGASSEDPFFKKKGKGKKSKED